jgi:hypothetical protein
MIIIVIQHLLIFCLNYAFLYKIIKKIQRKIYIDSLNSIQVFSLLSFALLLHTHTHTQRLYRIVNKKHR